jgi:valyl-tRNA synthetase
MAVLMAAIREIRNIRTRMNVAPSRKISLIVVSGDDAVRRHFAEGQAYLERLAGIAGLKTQADKSGIPVTAVTALFDGGEIYLPLADLIDLGQEIERLGKEKENLETELRRVQGKLSNEQFVSRAPAQVVQSEKDKLARYQDMLASANDRLNLLIKEQERT